MESVPSENALSSPPSIESREQKDVRKMCKNYFRQDKRQVDNAVNKVAPKLLDEKNRKIFIEEWAQAIKSAKDPNLRLVMDLGFDPHDNQKLNDALESKLLQMNPGAKKKPVNDSYSSYEYDRPSQLLPEYDPVRQALAEKFRQNRDLLRTVEYLGPLIVRHLLRPLGDSEVIAELQRPRQLQPTASAPPPNTKT